VSANARIDALEALVDSNDAAVSLRAESTDAEVEALGQQVSDLQSVVQDLLLRLDTSASILSGGNCGANENPERRRLKRDGKSLK